MEFFKNEKVAMGITALVIAGCLVTGYLRRPTEYTAEYSDVSSSVVAPVRDVSQFVQDEAGVLSSATERKINQYNSQWETDYNSVVAIATVDGTDGQGIENYTYDYGESLGLGANDMMVLVDVEDQQFWFVSSDAISQRDAYDAEDILWDMDDLNDIDDAILDFYEELDYAYANNHVENVIVTQPVQRETRRTNFVGIAIGLLILYAIVSAIDRARYRTWYRRGGGTIGSPAFIPLMFWRRPGSSWFRRMDNRMRTPPRSAPPPPRSRVYAPPPNMNSRPRTNPPPRSGPVRPGGFNGGGTRSGFGAGSRNSGGFSGGSSRGGFSGGSSRSGFGAGPSRGGSPGGSSRGGGFSGGGSRGGFGGRR